MDSPRWWNVLMQGRALHHAFTRSTLGFVGFSPVGESILYATRERSAEQVARFAARLAREAQRDVAKLKPATAQLTADNRAASRTPPPA